MLKLIYILCSKFKVYTYLYKFTHFYGKMKTVMKVFLFNLKIIKSDVYNNNFCLIEYIFKLVIKLNICNNVYHS